MAKSNKGNKATPTADVKTGTKADKIVGADFTAIHDLAIRSVTADRVLTAGKAIKTGAQSISQHLLKAAQTFPNQPSFKAETERQEKWLKSDEGMAEVNRLNPDVNWHGGKLPDCWKQAKSNIMRAWLQETEIATVVDGFTFKGCETESQMRQALNTYRNKRQARPFDATLERVGNILKSLDNAGTEGKAEARSAVDKATAELDKLADTYGTLMRKLVPAKPKAPEQAATKAA